MDIYLYQMILLVGQSVAEWTLAFTARRRLMLSNKSFSLSLFIKLHCTPLHSFLKLRLAFRLNYFADSATPHGFY
ncbi:hypothetical protein BpHYR1_013088, partial [Brachionus plicatilis]